jgi:hypothetical protein
MSRDLSRLRGQAVASLLIVAGLSGCDRPFVEQSQPTVDVASPDLGVVQTQDSITVRVTATSFRDVVSVVLNGAVMALDEESGEWVRRVYLSSGLNALEFVAVDINDVEGAQTFYAVKLPLVVSRNAPRLPTGVGSHSTVLLRDGDLLVTGGSPTVGAASTSDILLASSGDTHFQRLGATLEVARAGHTSLELPDGRVITLGGSRSDRVDRTDDLVEEVEIFNPETQRTAVVPVDGPPIRRAFHTASVRETEDDVLIDIYGGLGDDVFSSAARIGARDDLRTFRLEDDRLTALSPSVGAFLSEPISGHTQSRIDLRTGKSPGRFLYHGSRFLTESIQSVCMTVDFGSDRGILVDDVSASFLPRTRHAATTIEDGLIVIIGGLRSGTDPTAHTELYVDPVGIFMEHPISNAGVQLRRYGHTATFVGSDRILILGGFGATGQTFAQSEYLILDP